jgi:chitin synthase
MKAAINRQGTQAHVFEYTASFGLDSNLHFRYPDKGVVPTQILFCLKEKNQKKINSHRWFFNAFANMLQVSVATHSLLTRPLTKIAERLCAPRCGHSS